MHRDGQPKDRPARAALLAILLVAASACPRSSCGDQAGDIDAGVAAPASAAPSAAEASASAPPRPSLPPRKLRCPPSMISVAERFCIDKWEAQLIDKTTRTPLSPFYPPDRQLAVKLAEDWERDRETMGDEKAHAMPIPELPAWQREHDAEPMAVSRPGVIPNGYLSGVVSARACENAEKRLCRYDEWRTACEGEAKRQFPYGTEYVPGACNIFREAHPAVVLHDNATIGHLDPRLLLVDGKGGDPLLHLTGKTPRCKSEWGSDAAYDMNGNLDEWVLDTEREPDPKTGWRGRMVGGFFSRSRKDGCASSITAHPKGYMDYSTGTRCCWSPEEPGGVDGGPAEGGATEAGVTEAGAMEAGAMEAGVP